MATGPKNRVGLQVAGSLAGIAHHKKHRHIAEKDRNPQQTSLLKSSLYSFPTTRLETFTDRPNLIEWYCHPLSRSSFAFCKSLFINILSCSYSSRETNYPG